MAIERDMRMSEARKKLDWPTQTELAIDPIKAKRIREENPPGEDDVCTMCGKFCAIKQVKACFENSSY